MKRSLKRIRHSLSNKKNICLTALVPLTVLPQHAHAALTIILSATQVLNFGTITESGAGGTVTISTGGARSTTGSVSAITGSGLESNGIFTIAASTGVPIDLSVTAVGFTVSNGGGSNMLVNGINLVLPAGGTTETITLATSPDTFPVGATMNVSPSQAAGSYTGAMVLNANYQ
jgi:hypothetical protein